MVVKRDKKNKIIWTSSSTSSQAGGTGGAAMKYRPPRETPREETKGKLPCAEAASVQQVGSHDITGNSQCQYEYPKSCHVINRTSFMSRTVCVCGRQ